MAEADVAAVLLGPLELWVAGRRVERWNSLKARDVFQYLLIHRDRPVRRDVLMELEWPDHTRASARNNLKALAAASVPAKALRLPGPPVARAQHRRHRGSRAPTGFPPCGHASSMAVREASGRVRQGRNAMDGNGPR